MPTTIQYPLINGVRYDWSSLEIKLAPLNGSQTGRIIGFKEISYKTTLTPTKVYGTHAQPIGRTRGVLEPEASLTLYKEEAKAVREILGDGWQEQVFDISVTFTENGFDNIVDEIIGCKITSDDDSHSQGGDSLVVKWDLDVMMVKKNGRYPILNPLRGVSV